MKACFILAVLALATPSGATAPRQPAAQWVVDFAPTQCLASRVYGGGERPLTLAIKPSVVGDVVQLAMVLPARGGGQDAYEKAVKIGVDERPPFEALALAMRAAKAEVRSLRINLPLAFLDTLRAAKTLSIDLRGEPQEIFALSQMRTLIEAMNTCLQDLRQEWNVDAALKVRAKSQKPLAAYLSDADYPTDSISHGDSGTVGLTLLVDEAGKVADCMVTASSKAPLLDIQSCGVFIERARFTPAVGADGKPAKDAVATRIRWIMPD